jgi:glycerol-3-phosphate dehydrogenase
MTPPGATVNTAHLRDRQLQALGREQFDVAIIGGGIYGAMLLLCAANCGLTAVLLDRRDFGSETSFNSLRILHGGLRYLQSFDFQRSRESFCEQRWFRQEFPDLVSTLPCLLPLHNHGLRRPLLMRLAFGLDRLIGYDRNAGFEFEQRLQAARIISASETKTYFPQVTTNGLVGGAVWHDAAIPDTQRLVMEILNWARSRGGTALNYSEVTGIKVDETQVRGLEFSDQTSGHRHDIAAKVVINASGPWCEDLAARFDASYRRTAYPSVAWNVLFNREALSEYALGIEIQKPDSHVYFLHPWKGRLLAGTGHTAARDNMSCQVTDRDLNSMIADLNRAIPGLALSPDQVQRVMRGILPVKKPGSTSLSKRPIIYDHGAHGGPHGLVSVSGVKLGASRVVAENAMRAVTKRYFNGRYGEPPKLCDRPASSQGWQVSVGDLCGPVDEYRRAQLRKIIEDEMVMHIDDLVLRRTTLWENPTSAMDLAPKLLDLFDWDVRRKRKELSRLRKALDSAT